MRRYEAEHAPAGSLRPSPSPGPQYGLTNSLMKYGYNVDTLMSMYRGVRPLRVAQRGVDMCGWWWRWWWWWRRWA